MAPIPPGQSMIAILTAASVGEIGVVSALLDELSPEAMRHVLAVLVGAWLGTATLLASEVGVDRDEYLAEYLSAMGRKAAAQS